jgi:hypothetical protein
MARHALILINASPIFCGQHSMMMGAIDAAASFVGALSVF